MPVFLDYDKNGNLLSTRDEPLKPDNLPRYMIEHNDNIERLAGYKDAVADMLHLIGPAVWADYQHGEEIIQFDSLRRSMAPMIAIFKTQTEFLTHVEKFISKEKGLEDLNPL